VGPKNWTNCYAENLLPIEQRKTEKLEQNMEKGNDENLLTASKKK